MFGMLKKQAISMKSGRFEVFGASIFEIRHGIKCGY